MTLRLCAQRWMFSDGATVSWMLGQGDPELYDDKLAAFVPLDEEHASVTMFLEITLIHLPTSRWGNCHRSIKVSGTVAQVLGSIKQEYAEVATAREIADVDDPLTEEGIPVWRVLNGMRHFEGFTRSEQFYHPGYGIVNSCFLRLGS